VPSRDSAEPIIAVNHNVKLTNSGSNGINFDAVKVNHGRPGPSGSSSASSTAAIIAQQCRSTNQKGGLLVS